VQAAVHRVINRDHGSIQECKEGGNFPIPLRLYTPLASLTDSHPAPSVRPLPSLSSLPALLSHLSREAATLVVWSTAHQCSNYLGDGGFPVPAQRWCVPPLFVLLEIPKGQHLSLSKCVDRPICLYADSVISTNMHALS